MEQREPIKHDDESKGKLLLKALAQSLGQFWKIWSNQQWWNLLYNLKVASQSCHSPNWGWQIVELCINKKLAIEKTKHESKTEQKRKRKREREKKAKKTLRPHYEILLALSSLWIKMNYCTATAMATTTATTMATTVRTTITTRVNNGNGNHNTSKR